MMNKPETVQRQIADPRILVVPDQHFPFVNEEALKSMLAFAKEFKPTAIVNVGDTYDAYAFSRFSRSLNVMTPEREISEGRKQAVQMWKTLKKNAPKAECFQVLGNHEDRLRRKIMDRAPEYESLITEPLENLVKFDGVYSLSSSRSELVINETIFVHGWSTTPGFHVRYYGKNTVHGHTHKGSVTYIAHHGESLFELDCGFIADTNQIPLQYGDIRTHNWNLGFGCIDKYGPRFIAL